MSKDGADAPGPTQSFPGRAEMTRHVQGLAAPFVLRVGIPGTGRVQPPILPGGAR
jgi:hypothetical protein